MSGENWIAARIVKMKTDRNGNTFALVEALDGYERIFVPPRVLGFLDGPRLGEHVRVALFDLSSSGDPTARRIERPS